MHRAIRPTFAPCSSTAAARSRGPPDWLVIVWIVILFATRKKWVLHFPHCNFGNYREFKVLFLYYNDYYERLETKEKKQRKTHSAAIPLLAHHHDADEHVERERKEAMNVVLDGVADGDAES